MKRIVIKTKLLLGAAFALACSAASAQTSLRQPKAEEDTLREHFMEIANATYPIEKECLVALGLKYKVPADKANKLSYYVKERERRKVCYNYLYGDSILTRVRCKLEIDSIYRDSINALLIPVPGNRISGDNISLALAHRKLVGLDDAQYDYLMDRAVAMARKIYANPRVNVWNEEMDILRKTLTKTQLTNFFFDKNGKSVTKEIKTGWQKLVAAGLAEQLDSVKDVSLAFTYYHKRQKIKDLFRYYGTSQKKYLAELDKHKPPMVQMLATLEKEEREAARKEQREKNKTVGKEFAW